MTCIALIFAIQDRPPSLRNKAKPRSLSGTPYYAMLCLHFVPPEDIEDEKLSYNRTTQSTIHRCPTYDLGGGQLILLPVSALPHVTRSIPQPFTPKSPPIPISFICVRACDSLPYCSFIWTSPGCHAAGYHPPETRPE
jgi:hypothetical protein